MSNTKFLKRLIKRKKNKQNGNCGAEELSNLGPLYMEPKAYVEKEETPEDKQKESKLPRDIAEDNSVLGQPRS